MQQPLLSWCDQAYKSNLSYVTPVTLFFYNEFKEILSISRIAFGSQGMIAHWAYAGPSFLAAFMASLVEFFEALTVILAVGALRGWRGALSGAAAGVAILLLIIAILGPALSRIPLATIQLVVGALLLLFGLRWLRKAILRYAVVIPLHDEAATYSKETESMRELGRIGQR
ncbi:hypothetical protein ACT2FY_38190 [Paraburkholderia fungorum]|uniref:hypothetical protein n=1 Tax=Paraburkholderia fungorum TaxID=134537 RepID=UPI00402B872E